MRKAMKKELWLRRTSKKSMISRINFLFNREPVDYQLCAVQNVALYRVEVEAETPPVLLAELRRPAGPPSGAP